MLLLHHVLVASVRRAEVFADFGGIMRAPLLFSYDFDGRIEAIFPDYAKGNEKDFLRFQRYFERNFTHRQPGFLEISYHSKKGRFCDAVIIDQGLYQTVLVGQSPRGQNYIPNKVLDHTFERMMERYDGEYVGFMR